ncbi:polysaccharide biosynthesis C-terminal domain-containing protein [Streptomyces bambusae]|uniref:MATE family efflux transporter n=1 Tax=Streptomyces bambusae TaxID=1550616 RepID=UPI001CFF8203|nr:MATE family efflux transporter [Streptomyces bambusae]MCB5169837.1 polysaccharide biosynthesis C-terminal domain-containing protein [Streptomyces bambusae]
MRHTLLGLGVPVYLELLSGVVVGIVGTVWVARLGEAAVGAVAVATTLEHVLLGVVLMANVGATVLIAGALGSGRRADVAAIVRAAWLLWAVITPVVAVGGFLVREPVAALLTGGTGEVARLTAEFLAIALPGTAVFFAQNVADGILKGHGDTRTPMRTAVLANSLVLVLDPLLIHGAGPLPPMGVRGAALGTVLGRGLALCVTLFLLRSRLLRAAGPTAGVTPASGAAPGAMQTGTPGTTATLRAPEAVRTPTALRPATALRRLLGVGLPVSGDFVLRMAVGMSLVGIVARFGEEPLAAYGIGMKVLFLVTMACYAVRQAGSILTARTRGGGAYTEVLIGRQCVLLATLAAAGAGLALAVGGRPLMALFSDAPEVVDAGGVLMWFLLPYLVLLAGVLGLGGVFTGGGHGRSLFGVTVLGALVQLPLAFGLSAVPALGVRGVWLSMVLGTGAQYLLSYALFRRHFPAADRTRPGPKDGDQGCCVGAA